MSCTSEASRFGRLAGGVSGVTRLAGQRSFYAGVAAGVAGTLGVQRLLKTIPRRRTAQPGTRVKPRSLPPLDGGSDTREQPRPIPALAGDPPGRRVRPRQIPAPDDSRPGTRAKPRRIPLPDDDIPRPIPGLAAAPLPPTETKLKPGSIQVRTGSGQIVTAPNSYRVVRPDGSDTGLALTPTLTSNGEPTENSWGITHTASGSLVSGPYTDLKQAQSLATQLAGLRWGGLRVPAPDIEQARQIIAGFQPAEGGKG